MAVKTFTVTVVSTAGGNKYFIDGVQQATVALARGATYRFDQSDSSNATHPLVFSSDSGNSTPYTTGVTTAGTPGSGGAYTEIAVATSAPANLYYYCSNHAGMGGAANVTSDSFGALSWSVGNWNDQDSSTISTTGIGASFSLGTVTTDSTVEFGWGRDTYGARAWGAPDQIVNPSGIEMTAFEGTIDPAPDAMLTGIALTTALGDETAFTDIDVSVTGQALTTTLGNENAFSDSDITLTGLAITSVLGEETTAGEINTGWGRLTWGENAWGVAGDVVVSGIAMSASLGDETISVDAPHLVTGVPMTASLNVLEGVEISFEIELTGLDLTTNLGTADAGPDAMLTGNQATTSVGSVEAYNLEGWGRYFWGQFEWGATGQWDFATPTGQALTSSLGEETITADANVDLTGIPMTAAEGIIDPSPDATVVGIGMTASLAVGTVIAGEANVTVIGQGISMGLGVGTLDAESFIDVTGISMSANINGVTTTGSAAVPLTGIELTSTLNNANTLIWNEINTGSPAIWTEVPTRAA